jgi:hypothetical protein
MTGLLELMCVSVVLFAGGLMVAMVADLLARHR